MHIQRSVSGTVADYQFSKSHYFCTYPMVKIYSNNDFHSVHLLKALLNDEGITCIILNQKDSAYHMIGEEELYVNPDDVIRALEVIRIFEETKK